MKRVACIILIIALLISGLFFVRSANATVFVGTLSSDTEWTVADSPVSFNGTVIVANNVTLTIDPGVTVNLGMYSLYVDGTLIAAGNQSNEISVTATVNMGNSTNNINPGPPIFFGPTSTPWSDATNSGSIIQYATFNEVNLQINNAAPKIDNCLFNFNSLDTAPISIAGGSPVISNSTIDYTGQVAGDDTSLINVNGGTPLITNDLFEGDYSGSGDNGITVNSGAPQITNNQFEGNGYLNGIVDYSTSAFTIANNVFTNCLSGVLAKDTSVLNVSGNSFLSGTDGIDIDSTATLTITNNLVDRNSRDGIDGGGYIYSNTITNNQIGIHNPTLGLISNNNIVGNTVNSITATTANIDATNNWWGISDPYTINQTIYDAKVDSRLGTITFFPFLTQPSQTAPAIPLTTPNITPDPLPVFAPAQPTPIEEPSIMTPTPTPIPYSETFVYQLGTIINLNLITTAVAIILILAWIIVILGYIAKSEFSKDKSEN